MITGWDLSTKLCGWCAGTGETVPIAGAFELFDRGHLGKLGAEFQTNVMAIHRRFPATQWVVENPILTPKDALWTVQRIYGVNFLLWTLAEKLGIPCEGVDLQAVKRELAGRNASKDDMIAVAARMGVSLPKLKNEGREDAADAVGVWKVGVRLFARPYLARWDAASYGRRALL